jgi:hypothetical protein
VEQELLTTSGGSEVIPCFSRVLKATLKADVDVTEMNKYLQAYIQEEVKKGVANALVTLVEDIVDNKTEEAELRITEKLQEEVKKCVTNALPTLVHFSNINISF